MSRLLRTSTSLVSVVCRNIKCLHFILATGLGQRTVKESRKVSTCVPLRNMKHVLLVFISISNVACDRVCVCVGGDCYL